MLGEGAAASLMVGAGENYLPAFALAMGMGQVASGLISTIPLLIGAILQMVSPVAVRRLSSHRRWAVACAVLQAVSFLPLCVAAALGSMHVAILFGVVAIYWGAGLGVASTWSTWVEDLVPQRIRAPYFSRRTRLCQMATLAGFVAAGTSLQFGDWIDQRLLCFSLVFLLAGTCRGWSARFLSQQSESAGGPQQHLLSLAESVQKFRLADGRLLMYLLCVQAAAQIAGPYFTPYMLSSLKLSYGKFVLLIAASFVAKAASLPTFGNFAQRYGARRLLWLGGFGIVPVSGLWVFSDSFWYLLGVQVIAGVTWAAYELAMMLLFFETIRPAERTSVLTTFNLANALATVAGSLLGGGLLLLFGKTQFAYLLLFALSSLARGATLLALVRVGNGQTADGADDRLSTGLVPPVLPMSRVPGPLQGAAIKRSPTANGHSRAA